MEGSPFAVAFTNKIRTALGPFVELKRSRPELSAALQEQADCTLRYFCGNGDMKWISLMLWAGANPRTLGPNLDKNYTNDPECFTTALREASYSGNVEVLKKLKPDPKQDDLTELYEKVWSEPMRTLAQQYGVSDVYLARVCRLLRITLPGLGYWVKKSAGETTKKRPPLPPLPSEREQQQIKN